MGIIFKILKKLAAIYRRLDFWSARIEYGKLKSKLRRYDCLLTLTPKHSNLGDHAIAFAAGKMLKSHGIRYCEISDSELWLLQSRGELGRMNGKKIIINGGGNMGSLWPQVEELMESVVKENPDSPIIIFPNTIYYSADAEELRKKSIEIYNSHRDLTIFAREAASFEYMKGIYNRVLFAPDAVLALDESEKSEKRQGCLVCVRNDLERTMTKEAREAIFATLGEKFGDEITVTDTVKTSRFGVISRRYELNKIWNSFRGAKLVVTDRLHGMIFAAITGTPCIVLNSKSPKVAGCYSWISQLPYVKMIRSFDNISAELGTALREMDLESVYKYPVHKLDPDFAPIHSELERLKNM